MNGSTTDEDISLLKANEYLRQVRETFDQRKRQDGRGFMVWLVMTWMAAILMPGFLAVCTVIVLQYEKYPQMTVNAAAGTLFVDAFGAVLAIWRAAAARPASKLEPTLTDYDPLTAARTAPRPPARHRR